MDGNLELFDERFLSRYAGQIMSDPSVALVELVANSWDAYATNVEIVWPDKTTETHFSVTDNGKGMTRDEFEYRWRMIDYNRLKHQGDTVAPPDTLKNHSPRLVYGQNGKGRNAAFRFSSPYIVRTWKNGIENIFQVSEGTSAPIEIEHLDVKENKTGHGTQVIGTAFIPVALDDSDARTILSTRFLLDPSFNVSVNGTKVTFEDIPQNAIQNLTITIPGLGEAKVLVIDSLKADRTTKQHGIAWWTQKRLVGVPSWQDFDGTFIDGRKEEAKRFSFIITADFLKPFVEADWHGYKPLAPEVILTKETVHQEIKEILSKSLSEKRNETKAKVRESQSASLERLPQLSQQRWNAMLDELVEKCPSLSQKNLEQVMEILAAMEASESQYGLLEKLHSMSPNDVDDWNAVLSEWTIQTAKAALDEIAKRLKIIEEIRSKAFCTTTDEVQELQPLFEKSLWIFGPEYESIEFTSNQGMTTVIKKLFKVNESGSRNRPDFVILPDSTIGLYSRPSFDADSNENGVEALIIVELKRPGVSLGDAEKSQTWKYIKELLNKGLVSRETTIKAYVLGSQFDSQEGSERIEGNTTIRPVLYTSFIGQAEKRMLNLHKKLQSAPFLQPSVDLYDGTHVN